MKDQPTPSARRDRATAVVEHTVGEPDQVSKSQRKRDSKSLQVLGAALVALPRSQLARLALDEQLRQAVTDAADIRPGGARKRQIQYIGRLLRQIDAEAIRQALPGAEADRLRAARRQAGLERELNNILEGGTDAVEELLQRHSGLERQKLRQLARKARQGVTGSVPDPRALKTLRRYLAAHIEGSDGKSMANDR